MKANLLKTGLDLFLNEIKSCMAAGEWFEEACFRKFKEAANDTGNMGELDYKPWKKDSLELKVDGFYLEDNQLSIAISDFTDNEEITFLDSNELKSLVKKVQSLVKECHNENFVNDLEQDHSAFRLSELLREGFIHRIKIVIFSNKLIKDRELEQQKGTILEKPITYNFFDFKRYISSLHAKNETESIEIDIAKLNNGKTISCIQADSGMGKYHSFLAVMPGKLLADIYEIYQTRILEQNVRVFLQEKRAVNKGIINTASENPEMFFAYNNGITATASKVEFIKSDDALAISKIFDFQIVNGGQTTASLMRARDMGKSDLKNVFVQMKLNEISPDLIETIVPNIAKYANTQNRILKSDLFANHPFHKKMQEHSREILAPKKDDSDHRTYWFYERASGEYNNALASLKDEDKKTFRSSNPPDQKINKRDLFKFKGSFDKQPFKVSKGPESLFAEYSKEITNLWDENEKNIANNREDLFNKDYFKNRVAEAIIFKKTDELVSSNGWYRENRGYKDKIVPYTVSSLVYYLEFIKNKKINLGKIWDDQKVPAFIEYALSGLIQQVGEFLQKTPENISNVGEYAKRANCWNEMRHIVSADINVEDADDYLLPLEETVSRKWEDIPKSEFPIQLGEDPKGRTISVKIAKKGHFYIEFKGENKLQTDIRTLAKGETYNFPLNILSRLSAIELLDKGSRDVGVHPDDEGIIRYEIGTYGAYLTYNQKTFNIARQHDFRTFSIDEAIEIIDNQK